MRYDRNMRVKRALQAREQRQKKREKAVTGVREGVRGRVGWLVEMARRPGSASKERAEAEGGRGDREEKGGRAG